MVFQMILGFTLTTTLQPFCSTKPELPAKTGHNKLSVAHVVDSVFLNPNQPGGWHIVPQKLHLNLILLAIVHSDGNQTIFSRALLDADFGPVGRNQHPARLRERTLN